ncbi:MAG: putative porin [Flavobacteriaceae bacterium]
MRKRIFMFWSNTPDHQWLNPRWQTSLIIGILLLPILLMAQGDSLQQKIEYEGDFRFRVEQDWRVRSPDGSYLEDRSRLRYRARAGIVYRPHNWIEVGLRLRTGDPKKQQDPQITLGDEFSGIPVSFERAYAGFTYKGFSAWLGKNTFPFKRQNELFWSDNVYPEGVAAGIDLPVKAGVLQHLRVNTGHFIFATDGLSFSKDSYIQGIQLLSGWGQDRLSIFPGFFYFRQMPNIPDGNETFRLDYSIVHIGSRLNLMPKNGLTLEVDYYQNLENLSKNDSIPSAFVDQKKGLTLSMRIGDLDKRGHWFFRTSYNYQERYAAVDFLAQNDWARWDYSSQGSLDGRLTNYKGLELMAAYAITKNIDVQTRWFFVEQLIPLGVFRETNNRVRFDINISL